MKTPTDCCANTFPRAPIYRYTPPPISPPSPMNSTPDPAKPSTGQHRPNASISYSHKRFDRHCVFRATVGPRSSLPATCGVSRLPNHALTGRARARSRGGHRSAGACKSTNYARTRTAARSRQSWDGRPRRSVESCAVTPARPAATICGRSKRRCGPPTSHGTNRWTDTGLTTLPGQP
jgi:hypothetical protein